MKIYFLVKGFGEYAQAYAVAKRLKEEEHETHFLCADQFIQKIISTDGFTVYPLDFPDEIKSIIYSLSGNALFLCNSHTTYNYGLSRPPKVKKIFTLDSNWYFNDELYPYKNYTWVDIHYIVFPESYFLSNLKENGGNFQIDPFFTKKIYTPGFVPTHKKLSLEEKISIRRKYNITDDKLFVAIYHSSPNVMKNHPFTTLRDVIVHDVKDMLHEFEEIYKKQIVVINLSDQTESMRLHKTQTFDDLIVSSDLVVMHHGYGTLPKLFHNQIPVVSFTEIPQNTFYASYYELKPAIEAHAIRHFYYENYKKDQLKGTIYSLLTDNGKIQSIKQSQQKIFKDGLDDLIAHFYREAK